MTVLSWEAKVVMDRVREQVPWNEFRRLTVLEVLALYRKAKAEWLAEHGQEVSA